MENPLPSTPIPSSSPIGEPVTSSFSGSNGTASELSVRARDEQMPGRRIPGEDAPHEHLGLAPRELHPHDLNSVGRLVRAPGPEDDAAGAGQQDRPLAPISFRSTAL